MEYIVALREAGQELFGMDPTLLAIFALPVLIPAAFFCLVNILAAPRS